MIDLKKPKLGVEQGTKEPELTNEQAQELARHSALVGFVRGYYEQARTYRQNAFDTRGISAYNSWRGIHSPEEQAQINKVKEKNPLASSIFIKITKTKVQAAVAQLNEILFADGKVPVGVEATPVPEGVEDTIHFTDGKKAKGPVDVYGYAGDGKDIKPGTTHTDLLRGLGSNIKDTAGSLTATSGPSPDPAQAPQFHPALEAAFKMDRLLQDQMEESKVRKELAKGLDELPLLGTMVLKGPFTAASKVTEWYRDAVMGRSSSRTVNKFRPMMKQVSCWNVYPTPGAVDMEDVEQIVERHRFTKSRLRRLKSEPFFDKAAIDELLANETPTMEREDFEQQIRDGSSSSLLNRYEILEYWGYLDAELIRYLDVEDYELPEDYNDPVQVNIWVCNGKVLRAILNPFETQELPYYFVPYERHPYQLWGIGIAENMQDSQDLMNGHMRMSIDNLRLSGNVMLEINQTRFAKGQDLSFFPGKAFFTQGGAVNQSIYPIQVPNVAPQHMQMFDKARQLADDQTGFPSYAHGSTGVMSTGRTASGMSMLMSAAAQNIKQVVKNIDDYLLEPMGQAFFRWNMNFNEDMPEIFGDEKVVAKGTSALMQKEVQSQRLMMFLQTAQGSPFANQAYIYREIAKSLSLDPDKVIVDPRTAMLQAQMMGMMNNAGNSGQATGTPINGAPQPGGAGPAQPAVAGANPADTQGTGGGTIGFGTPPVAG